MAEQLSPLLDKAASENLTVLDVVDRLCDEEKASRLRNAIGRRIRDARFPELNTVDAFNFDFCPVRKKLRARYLALHDLSFIERGVNPLFIGLPGTGKTFLARALAYRACQAHRRVVLVSAPGCSTTSTAPTSTVPWNASSAPRSARPACHGRPCRRQTPPGTGRPCLRDLARASKVSPRCGSS